ncbi:MAG: HD domain-containing protein, partial [Firmicutes bacterium]|nr:HD domain-containing protein [Bacillota bacterium]
MQAKLFQQLLTALALVLDLEEHRKLYHGWRVGLVAAHLGRALWPEGAAPLFYGGILHDLGAIGLEDHIIHYPELADQLSRPEILAHTERSAAILSLIPGLEGIAPDVRDHHQWWNGRGFPGGKKGAAISLGAQILRAADAFDLWLRQSHDVSPPQAINFVKSRRNLEFSPLITDALAAMVAREDVYEALLSEGRLDGLIREEMARSPLPLPATAGVLQPDQPADSEPPGPRPRFEDGFAGLPPNRRRDSEAEAPKPHFQIGQADLSIVRRRASPVQGPSASSSPAERTWLGERPSPQSDPGPSPSGDHRAFSSPQPLDPDGLLFSRMNVAVDRVIRVFAQVIDAKHSYTAGHSERVTLYGLLLAEELGLAPAQLNTLTVASLLHDAGKVAVPRKILDKPARLDEAERAIIQTHPAYTIEILSTIDDLRFLAAIAGGHHERYDGRGYPHALARQDIPFLARIMAIADAFDAMTSHRPYQKNRTVAEALAIIAKGAGTQFDPDLAEVAQGAYHGRHR